MKNMFCYKTDIGNIGIVEDGIAITNLYFCRESYPQDAIEQETVLTKEAYRQLKEYLAGMRKEFELPVAPAGTEFQRKVWKALQAIPYGETRSYGEIARIIGQPTASRSIGMANSKNPIMLLIPCHRVIGADGKLVGYAGGMTIKQYLLNLENKYGN